MPRKGSSKQSLKNVARWLEWRCGQKWQYVVVPKQNNLAPDLAADLARFYTPGEHEGLIDRFITPEGPQKEKEIREQLKIWLRNGILSGGEWSALMEIANAKAPIFPAIRPWEIPDMGISLVREIDELALRQGVHGACRIIGTRMKIDPEVLRGRYRRAKIFWDEK
jgi:hypothetical protein